MSHLVEQDRAASVRGLVPKTGLRLGRREPASLGESGVAAATSVRVGGVVREDVAAIRRHDPGHPLADENGDVWEAPVDENAEMVEMLEASRQYRNMIEAMSTAKQLMLETMRMK